MDASVAKSGPLKLFNPFQNLQLIKDGKQGKPVHEEIGKLNAEKDKQPAVAHKNNGELDRGKDAIEAKRNDVKAGKYNGLNKETNRQLAILMKNGEI